MDKKKLSNKRYNKYKKDTNIMISETEQGLKVLNKINDSYSVLNNTPQIYMDKIYEIYNDLNKESIDFWSNDFILREAIVSHLRIKTLESIVYLRIILEKILLLPNITIKSKVLNNLTVKRMSKEIKEIKKIEEYIKNYDYKKDLIETLTEYFSNIPIEIMGPGDITKIYELMRQNIEDQKIEKILLPKENDILNIIEEKEQECEQYSEKKELLRKKLSIILTELEKVDEKTIKTKKR